MTSIASVSRTELTQRREKLRRQRQWKILQAVWRTLAVSGLTGGMLWMTTQPIWVLSTPEQIAVSGNNLLSERALQSLLKISYPKSLWRIEPSAIANSLEKQAPISQATVSRRLFPPGLIVQVKERIPVAIAQPPQPRQQAKTQATLGLLDENGVWMSLDTYTSLATNFKPPSLKIIGIPEQYRPYWHQLYQTIIHSPIKVTEVDCRNPTNLVLKTELGPVHLGSDISLMPEQLKVLAQMRQLPKQMNSGQIRYIDLKNPLVPLVQMNSAASSGSATKPSPSR